MTTITEYAHLYLQGYNTVPLGVLANPEFKAEVARLWGPEPIKEEQIKHLRSTVARLEKALMPLYGPRGGLPKQYRSLEFQYYKLKGELEQETA
jgi:hypothetical protein